MQCKLSDISVITMGQSPKSSTYNNKRHGLPFLQGGRTFGDKYPYFDTWTTKWNKEANSGDILFTVRAPVGDINIATTKIAIGRGIASIKPTKVSTKYLFYLLQVNTSKFLISSAGTIFASINKNALSSIQLNIHLENEQLHIVNTIGTVDDLIENLVKQNKKIINIGIIKINNLNNKTLKNLTEIVEFLKGREIGSLNYSCIKKDNMINYIRVSDLLSLGTTFVEYNKNLVVSNFDDILCAFDGAPGRNNIGLVGIYSSSIYNLKCDNLNKGLVFFEINSDLNQKIITKYSQGTTILHASKSISYLQYADIEIEDKIYFNLLFNLLIQNKKKIEQLTKIKSNLLNKFF